MKLLTNKRAGSLLSRIGSLALAVCCLTSCNETMEGTLKQDYPESGTNSRKGHVLMVLVDGMSGSAVQAARNAYKAPNLKSMASTAMYTDYGLADQSRFAAGDSMTNVRGWANLMLGNTKHGIFTDKELEEAQKTSFVDRLLANGRDVEMFVSDEAFYKNFVPTSLNATLQSDDEAVKNSTVSALNAPGEPADFVLAQFKSVHQVGVNQGFYDEDGSPTDAVINQVSAIDGYIGEIYAALQARPNFGQENWLVVVTSNYGGDYPVDPELENFYNDRRRNTFTLVSNTRLVSTAQARPSESSISYNYATPVWSYDYRYENPTRYAESAKIQDLSLGSLNIDPETLKPAPMTISFFAKIKGVSRYGYTLLSKSVDILDNGWVINFNGWGNGGESKKICFTIGGTRGVVQYRDFSGIDWTEWHVVTLTVAPDEIKKVVTFTLYLDGKENGSSTQTFANVKKWYYGNGRKGNPEERPLRIGGIESRASQNSQRTTAGTKAENYVSITNIQLYDTVMVAADVKKYSGTTMLHKLGDTYPYWKNLKGYWPCDQVDDEGIATLKDYSQYRKEDGSTDFVIDRGAKNVWESGTSSTTSLHPILESDPTFYHNTFNTVDLSREMLLWLGQPILFDWRLEGKAWQLSYQGIEDENTDTNIR